MKTSKRILAVLLVFCLLFSTVAATVAAAGSGENVKKISDGYVAEKRDFSSEIKSELTKLASPFRHLKLKDDENALKKTVVETLGSALNGLIELVLKIFPDRNFTDYDDYKSENFLSGTVDYKTAPAEGARWNVGYSRVSIIPDDVFEHDYYTAGYFNNYTGQMKVTEVLDDQCMTVVCVNDGSGSGTAVFISLDGFAISNANVRRLRERLKDFIVQNKIVSLNITTTHSHYCIDTSGLGTALLPFVGENLLNSFRLNKQIISSTDEKFMEVLFSRGAQAVKDAYADMKPGKLYFRTTNIADMINDKQTPLVLDENINTLRFVPDEAGDEIWLVNAGIHPTGYNRNSTAVSAEYPYMVIKYALELAGAKAAFYQGAQEEISKDTSLINEAGIDSAEVIRRYGKLLVERVIAFDSEQEVKPYLNVTHAEIFLKIDNPVLMAAAKLQLINNNCVKTNGKFEDSLLVTEIGYCEFGDELSLFLCPGELAPEIVFGGAKTAAESWNGTDWEYAPFEDIAGKKMIAFGLTNDEVGYILPDNDSATAFADTVAGVLGDDPFGQRNSHYAELLAISPDVGSSIAEYFMAMLKDYRGF